MSVDEDARWLDWVTKQFESIAGDDKEIDLEEFKTALKVKEAKRFFALFDSDGSGSISLDELLKALNLLIHGSETDKLHFLFQVYDVDGSGSIDPDELRTVLKSCLRESAISLPEEKLDDLTLALFESADRDNSGSITFEELKAELEKFPEVMENLTISAANWLKPPNIDKKRQTPRYLTPAYWHNNSRKLLFLCCYVCLNILLFTLAALKHTAYGIWIMIAKGCGQCLNFNCALVVWTNRLYEHFRRPQVMISETKRLTKSLRNKPKQSQQRPFNFTDHNGTVASNRDEHIELTSYKINWLPQGGSPQAMVQAENGECPQLQECYVDGPYGTPTRRIFTSEHAVLIGAGIGITPFASILQSIMYRYRMRKQNCPNCNYSWCENLKDHEMNLRKVDFIWINRDQKSFEWFVSLLTKLEMDQADEEPEGKSYLERLLSS
ncbi:NOX5 oxidase, partial [Polypterus senegalus]|nr:NOX5 oxidase [Polypterus senegalus]